MLYIPQDILHHIDFLAPNAFVYFISDGEYTKIGFAKDMIKRLKSLQIGNPKPLKIISFIPCGTEYSGRRIEQHLHNILKESRTCGEWFSIDPNCFSHKNFNFIVDYEDWRLLEYEKERRIYYKRKYFNG